MYTILYDCIMSRMCPKRGAELRKERKSQEFFSEEFTLQNLLELLILLKHTAAESVLG